MSAKIIFVTGGNAGIGYALWKQLVVEHGCFVYMGARSLERGNKAIKSLIEEAPEASSQLALVQIDTSNADSVQAATTDLAGRLGDNKLFALVNNAGTGIQHNVSNEVIIQTNLYGVKLVTEAFVPLIDASEGRIVNLGSGAAPGYVRKLADKAVQEFLSSKVISWEELEEYVTKKANFPKLDAMGCYGLSKAALHKYTEISAKAYPYLKINAVSPGFIETNMTRGFGATLPPEKGTVSIRHCLFKELKGNGWYYGSDALRSPLHLQRDPGDPEFEGYWKTFLDLIVEILHIWALCEVQQSLQDFISEDFLGHFGEVDFVDSIYIGTIKASWTTSSVIQAVDGTPKHTPIPL